MIVVLNDTFEMDTNLTKNNIIQRYIKKFQGIEIKSSFL